MSQHVKLYARVNLDVGSQLGYTAPPGDSETYYILEGKARYHDNGTIRILEPFDVTHTPDGASHGIENIGTTPLVFMALIISSVR